MSRHILLIIIILISTYSCVTINEAFEQLKTKETVEVEEEEEEEDVNPYDQYRFSTSEFPITEAISDREYISKFKILNCKKLKEEICVAKYKEMFEARLKLKYKDANFGNIEQICIGYPVECSSNQYVEKLFILSNNFNVDIIEKQERDRIQKQQDDLNNAIIGSLLTGVANQQQRDNERSFIREQINLAKERTCTSRVDTFGNSVTTNCQ